MDEKAGKADYQRVRRRNNSVMMAGRKQFRSFCSVTLPERYPSQLRIKVRPTVFARLYSLQNCEVFSKQGRIHRLDFIHCFYLSWIKKNWILPQLGKPRSLVHFLIACHQTQNDWPWNVVFMVSVFRKDLLRFPVSPKYLKNLIWLTSLVSIV